MCLGLPGHAPQRQTERLAGWGGTKDVVSAIIWARSCIKPTPSERDEISAEDKKKISTANCLKVVFIAYIQCKVSVSFILDRSDIILENNMKIEMMLTIILTIFFYRNFCTAHAIEETGYHIDLLMNKVYLKYFMRTLQMQQVPK